MNKRTLTLFTAAPALALAVAVVVFVGPTRGQDNNNGGDAGNPDGNDAGNGGMVDPNGLDMIDPSLLLPMDETSPDATTEPSVDGATTQDSTTQPIAEGPTSRPGQPPRTLVNGRRFRSRNTTPPVDPVKVTRPMSKDFVALLNRSVFMKGPQHVVDTFGASTTRPVTTQPVATIFSAQHNTVFNGVTESDAAVALFEDVAAHRVLKLHVGEAIAGGKITAIAFDSIDFEINGKVTHVMIGQNLEGGVTTPTSGPAAYMAEGTGSSSGGGGDSVLERLRRKRQQELSK